ncbi:MAG: lipoate--protein ligase family protein [Euryarchaeota archaeon]|nr:lipoate--protein ligase family protein [Euryarchaeota archaeon]
MWRLVNSDLKDAAYTTAADEAILMKRVDESAPNTLHLYRREKPTVSLGYFQKVEKCIDPAIISDEGIILVRRMSGGSAIYSDRGQITYSLITSEQELPGTIIEVFERISNALVDALLAFGIDAKYSPPNDILVNGRKISGSAQIRRLGCIAQHGTILVDTNLELMNRVLLTPKRSTASMTTMSLELGKAPSINDVNRTIVDSFQENFRISLTREEFKEDELQLITHLMKTKYCNEQYTFMR